jgi:hypothetical protein
MPRLMELVLEIRPWFRFWLDDFPGSFHARHGWRFLLLPLIAQHFPPELLSMNFLMAGMTPVMTLAIKVTPSSPQSSRTNVLVRYCDAFSERISLGLFTCLAGRPTTSSFSIARRLR